MAAPICKDKTSTASCGMSCTVCAPVANGTVGCNGECTLACDLNHHLLLPRAAPRWRVFSPRTTRPAAIAACPARMARIAALPRPASPTRAPARAAPGTEGPVVQGPRAGASRPGHAIPERRATLFPNGFETFCARKPSAQRKTPPSRYGRPTPRGCSSPRRGLEAETSGGVLGFLDFRTAKHDVQLRGGGPSEPTVGAGRLPGGRAAVRTARGQVVGGTTARSRTGRCTCGGCPKRRAPRRILGSGRPRPKRAHAWWPSTLAGFVRDARRRRIRCRGHPRPSLDENFDQVAPFVGELVDRETFDEVEAHQKGGATSIAAADSLRGTDSRSRRIREGHGDLRLEHVYLLPRAGRPPEITIIDCIEFNERFRCGDAAAEVAFLAMELEAAGRPGSRPVSWPASRRPATTSASTTSSTFTCRTGPGFAARWRRSWPPMRARPLSCAVEAARRRGGISGSRARLAAFPCRRPSCSRWAERPAAARARSPLGSEKRSRFRWARLDCARKALAGIAPTTRGDGHLYTTEMTERTYASLSLVGRGARVRAWRHLGRDLLRLALAGTGGRSGEPIRGAVRLSRSPLPRQRGAAVEAAGAWGGALDIRCHRRDARGVAGPLSANRAGGSRSRLGRGHEPVRGGFVDGRARASPPHRRSAGSRHTDWVNALTRAVPRRVCGGRGACRRTFPASDRRRPIGAIIRGPRRHRCWSAYCTIPRRPRRSTCRHKRRQRLGSALGAKTSPRHEEIPARWKTKEEFWSSTTR